MFTFSPESINEESTESHFTIDMLTHPDDFDINRARNGDFEGDVITADVNYRTDDGTYYIGIQVKNYTGVSRYGTFTFTYYDVDNTTPLFTKTFTVSLPVTTPMFTFSPESINEATSNNRFMIAMLTHPDDFDSARATLTGYLDIEDVFLIEDENGQYFLDITVKDYSGENREGTITFTYYDAEKTTVLFTQTFTIALTVPPAMFTFSPESINETSTGTHFTIDMLTHPGDFDSNRVFFDDFEGDVNSASLKKHYSDGTYYIDIRVADFNGDSRYGSFKFGYYDDDRVTPLFTKTFTVSIAAPDS